MNSYYDPNLKRSRLDILNKYLNFYFIELDICNYEFLLNIFDSYRFSKVCHLAAQAGVRYSIESPFSYQKSNNEGFLNILECVRRFTPDNFVYASSSSVYGMNEKLPFSEDDRTDNPVSLYAATKKANEVMAYSYSNMYKIPCSGVRYFTCYGPYGRPDMALFSFTKSILEGKPIEVYNNGKMKRNFTYIDDVVDGTMLVLNNPKEYEIYNIGNNKTVELMRFIKEIEKNVGKKAIIDYKPMQKGDVLVTFADISKISKLGYSPITDIEEGVAKFVQWYRQYYL